MARGEMGPEELRSIKESVNTEGTQMEEGEDGGAAVYVGTKEEVTKARQLAETEGHAPDMASYIVMHKEILARSDELRNYGGLDLAKDFEKTPIGAVDLMLHENGLLLYFKDSSSNLAKVEIDTSKITSLKSELSRYGARDVNAQFEIVMQELLKLGFRSDREFVRLNLRGLETQIENSRLDKIKDEQRKGFAF